MAAVDNDVLKKAACYRLLPDLFIPSHAATAAGVGILGSARYVLHHRLQHSGNVADVPGALASLQAFIDAADEIDPTEEEQRLSADLELAAQSLGLPLDAGESQLCAVVVLRAIPRLITGDKKAVTALEILATEGGWLNALQGRTCCFEQAVLVHLGRKNAATMKELICREPDVDHVLSICFACDDDRPEADSAVECLESYIEDLRQRAPSILAG